MLYWWQFIRRERRAFVNYIVLDLEWNQPLSRQSAPFRELGERMPFEIFQIGAMKLDESFELVDRLEGIVRLQQYKKLHYMVKKLTGVTAEEIGRGRPFDEVAEEFYRWCGEEFTLITWGYDDIPILKQNLTFYGLDTAWCDRWYNLQVIFNEQRGEGKNQRSLEYAMEAFEIPQDYPRHNAAADAYYTARVAQRLDLATGLPAYEQMIWRMRPQRIVKTKKLGVFPGRKEALSAPKVGRICCPVCGQVLREQTRWKGTADGGYRADASCETHGDFTARLRFKKIPQGFAVTRVIRTAKPKEEAAAEAPKTEKEPELV